MTPRRRAIIDGLRSAHIALEARGADYPRAQWEARTAAGALRSLGIEVRGEGARLVAWGRCVRRAEIDYATETWEAGTTPRRWCRDGTEADVGLLEAVAAWLLDGVEPDAEIIASQGRRR